MELRSLMMHTPAEADTCRLPASSNIPVRAVDSGGQLQWLFLDDHCDYATWLKHWETSAYRRPHDHPGFLELVRPDHYSPAVLLYRHAEDACITYPFFYCEINRFAEFSAIRKTLRHLVSPYGYGGALYEGRAGLQDAASERFERLLERELAQNDFVTEFVREDIFPQRLARRCDGEAEQQPNVVVRLDRSEDEIRRGYKHAVRGNVNKAIKSGLRVSFDPGGERLDAFLRIYYETMERRGASDNFYFPRDRFAHLSDMLGKYNGMMYVHVHDGDEIVSSELLLLSHDTVYSFLGGSLASAFSKRPNNLLKHEAILWGARNGYKRLVLGGGLSPGDELFRFKQSYDPEGIVPFSVRRIIHDQENYDLLVKARREYERGQGREWQPRPGFFPRYLSRHYDEGPTLVSQDRC